MHKKVHSQIQKDLLPIYNASQDLIKKFEGCILYGYICAGGYPTIGYGNLSYLRELKNEGKFNSNLKGKSLEVELKKITITEQKAEDLFKKDFEDHAKGVVKVCKNIKLNYNQLGALVSFSYNVGIANLQRSTLLKVIQKNPNNYKEIEVQFNRWVFAGGKKPLRGLINRRKAEFDLYSKP